MVEKNGYPEHYEVGQLQKKFFPEFVLLQCFQSGIMPTASILPNDIIFDHFYEEKSGILAKMGKNRLKKGKFGAVYGIL